MYVYYVVVGIQNTHKLKTAPTSNIIYAAPPCLFPQLSSLRRILWIYYVCWSNYRKENVG